MPNKKPVVVYGVSGYTGRLVCEYLREYNIPFIAAGRDKKRVQDVVDKIPGIETADYEVVGVEHNRRALEYIPAERLMINPDCGLRHLAPDVARQKLRAMVAGVALVRAELPGGQTS